MAEVAGPEYQRLMRLIRSRITSGEYPIRTAIPSTTRLAAETGMSVPVVRRAVDQLKADGILEGHPGKGVFVRIVPEEADRERASLAAVSGQVAELAKQVEGYDDLRARVGRLEINLMHLYQRLGFEYPHGGEHDSEKEAPGRGRDGRQHRGVGRLPAHRLSPGRDRAGSTGHDLR